MKAAWVQAAVVGALVLASAPGTSEMSNAEAASAASELAARLGTSPPVSAWVSADSKESGFQADVNRMAFLSAMLAAELSKGESPIETAGIYRDLRDVGIRILARSRTSGERLPPGDVEAYEQLMSKLEAFYGEKLSAASR
jgi:hypothetical protein